MQVLRGLLLITFKCQQGLFNSFEFRVDICRSQGKHLEDSQRFNLLRFRFNIMISNYNENVCIILFLFHIYDMIMIFSLAIGVNKVSYSRYFTYYNLFDRSDNNVQKKWVSLHQLMSDLDELKMNTQKKKEKRYISCHNNSRHK